MVRGRLNGCRVKADAETFPRMAVNGAVWGHSMNVINASSADLQRSIDELAAFADRPAADWVEKVNAALTEVIAGAILRWAPTSMMTAAGPDPMLPRREAAQALLQARLSCDSMTASEKVRSAVHEF